MTGGRERALQGASGRCAVVNGRLVLPDKIVTDQGLLLEGESLVAIAPVDAFGADVVRIDAGGRYVAPGLVDIHTHGALGHTFNEPTGEAYGTIVRENARRGTTALVATVATAGVPDMLACLSFAREWMAQPRQGAQVLGVHLEGPYMHRAQAGALDPGNLRTPDDGTPELFLEYADVLRIVSYAPELPGALELTRTLVELGIAPAAGHSTAREEDLLPIIEAGLHHMVHLWSAQSTTVREGPWRKPGLLEVSLTREDLSAEMIADNRHLPPTLMKLAYKAVGPERLCIVSDATSGAGLPEGTRFRMGDMEYEVHDGVGMMFDRSAFAGSTTLLGQMVPILVQVVGVPVAEAVRMASLNPARVIGVDDHKGSLEPGKDADLVFFDDDGAGVPGTVWRTMIAGCWTS
jgi:N-acetylglucosamine-6-phosphate deacetylase